MNVAIHSRKSIEELLKSGFPENTAVISIYDSGLVGFNNDYKPVLFPIEIERVFQFPLLDMDIDELEEYEMTFDTFFPEADELSEFICNAIKDGFDIICQCEYGQSRSAGCAAAILEYFENNGIYVFSDYRYYPNKLMYHKLLDALNKHEKEKVTDDKK